MTFKDVPIPGRMQHLKRDRRGYPVPVGVLIDTDGRPHFTINDENIRQVMIAEDRCHICGQFLTKGRCLVGGPASAFHPEGAYIDPCMHKECARYALMVCPYLAAPSYAKRIDDKTLDPAKLPGWATILNDPTMIDVRPDPFVLVYFYAQDQTLIVDEVTRIVKYIKPREIRAVEFWSKGVQLSMREGAEKAQAYMNETIKQGA